MKISMLFFLSFLLSLSIIKLGFTQSVKQDYTSIIAKAKRDRISTDTFLIRRLELDNATLGKNTFRALVRNKKTFPVTMALILYTHPGYWSAKGDQSLLYFTLQPGEQRAIAADYTFRQLSSEASLTLLFLSATPVDNKEFNLGKIFVQKKYPLGVNNPAVNYDLSKFRKIERGNFELYCYPNSYAEKNAEQILQLRLKAMEEIQKILDITYEGKIRLCFYPDEAAKKEDIGHIGMGLAFDNNIVEIYNETQQLDPYHELTHIVSYQLGTPPAFLDEGFAVYMSEKLGADALEYIGSKGKTIRQATKAFLEVSTLFPLEKLSKFSEIGTPESNASISYPQSASIVKYLIEHYGIESFRQTFKKMRNSEDAVVQQENEAIFKQIYGKSLAEIEKEWLSQLDND